MLHPGFPEGDLRKTNLGVAVATNLIEKDFQQWRVQNKKFYANSIDYQRRLSIFTQNVKRIEEFNAGDNTFTVGLNYFSDLENSEFRALYTMANLPMDHSEYPMHVVSGVSAPASWDWRAQGGMVNAVKDQGQCGSCWAFGGAQAMESANAIAGNGLKSFSEQNILDCSWSLGNQGCNGGWHNWAIQYVINNNGIDSEASYPYTATSSKTCKYNVANKAGTVGHVIQVANSASALQDASAAHVIAIAIDASHWSFQQYKTGVYNEPACSSTSLDHAVGLVGYGDLNGTPYWIVRNSWGASWGMSGYILMTRDAKNQCGVQTKAYYATM
jgi:cathepsin L